MTRVTGLVLAAGTSQRLGRPKQLLRYRGTTLLGATLDRARSCPFDRLVVTIGGAAAEVRAQVDLHGVDVVENVAHRSGCSSSIVAALDRLDPATEALVLLLGDQPDVTVHTVTGLIARCGAGPAPLGVCRYRDGWGHPFWFGRPVFDELRALHGDKGVWKLLESGRHPVTEFAVEGTVPLDVDTWDDYAALLARDGTATR